MEKEFFETWSSATFWPALSASAQMMHSVGCIVALTLAGIGNLMAVIAVVVGAMLSLASMVHADIHVLRRLDETWTPCGILLTFGLGMTQQQTVQGVIVGVLVGGVLGGGLLPQCADASLLWALERADMDGAWVEV